MNTDKAVVGVGDMHEDEATERRRHELLQRWQALSKEVSYELSGEPQQNAASPPRKPKSSGFMGRIGDGIRFLLLGIGIGSLAGIPVGIGVATIQPADLPPPVPIVENAPDWLIEQSGGPSAITYTVDTMQDGEVRCELSLPIPRATPDLPVAALAIELSVGESVEVPKQEDDPDLVGLRSGKKWAFSWDANWKSRRDPDDLPSQEALQLTDVVCLGDHASPTADLATPHNPGRP